MNHFDYTDLTAFLHDQDLIHLLCADTTYADLLDRLLKDDFLQVDPGMKVPFFAESATTWAPWRRRTRSTTGS